MNRDININVKSSYVPERSNPIQPYFLFTYAVYIENNSNITTKLLSRYWSITDGSGMSEDIAAQLRTYANTIRSNPKGP